MQRTCKCSFQSASASLLSLFLVAHFPSWVCLSFFICYFHCPISLFTISVFWLLLSIVFPSLWWPLDVPFYTSTFDSHFCHVNTLSCQTPCCFSNSDFTTIFRNASEICRLFISQTNDSVCVVTSFCHLSENRTIKQVPCVCPSQTELPFGLHTNPENNPRIARVFPQFWL